jgi:hypothetical protein
MTTQNTGTEVGVNTDKLVHLVLPQRFAGAELSEDDLEKVTGGLSWINPPD